MADLGTIGGNSLYPEGPLLAITGVENSLGTAGMLYPVFLVENSLKSGPGYFFAGKTLSASTCSATLTGYATAGAVILSISSSKGNLTGIAEGSGGSISFSGDGSAIRADGSLQGETVSMSSCSALLGAVPVVSAVTYHRVSSWQPVTMNQDYASFVFWQRRVSARQPRVRRLTP